MKLLCVIPTCRADVARAEQLCDQIYALDGKQKKGSCLLVFSPDVHAEMKGKLKIAAELAFETVDVLELKEGTNDKAQGMWQSFRSAAHYIAANFRYPWLWLEPDCLPLFPGWREKLSEAYDAQPKRYLSRRMKAGGESGDVYFAHRVGIYPVNCLADMEGALVAEVNFFESIIGKATISDLFQQVQLSDAADVSKIRQNAVLAHSDKSGALIDWVLKHNKTVEIPAPRYAPPMEFPSEALDQPISCIPGVHFNTENTGNGTVVTEQKPLVTEQKRRGRPPKVKPEPVPSL